MTVEQYEQETGTTAVRYLDEGIKEEEDQARSDFHTYLGDSQKFQMIESTEDKSENAAEDNVSTQIQGHTYDPLGNDHRIIKLLGQGNFGQVVKCYNYKTGRFEAVKILKSKSDVISMADKEVQILKRLQCLDSDECHIAKFNNFFSEKARTCLSFELRDLDLFSYISNTKGPPLNRGLALSEVRAITHQLATALHYLKTIGIIHGDIKPNNIMVVNRQEEPLNVKLADFSTAQYCGNINSNISPCTNCYSSPEVLLNCPFDEAIDMWSLGLTVVVAALGTDFIPPLNNNYDILKFIINIMGQPPDHVLDNGELSGFDDIKDEIILKQGPQTGLDLFMCCHVFGISHFRSIFPVLFCLNSTLGTSLPVTFSSPVITCHTLCVAPVSHCVPSPFCI
uniref:Protein kinase domain-containing protein n=1 Tax=Takifugu rubripes TaxID=31033 RepID=A0A674NHP8_TAKRU